MHTWRKEMKIHRATHHLYAGAIILLAPPFLSTIEWAERYGRPNDPTEFFGPSIMAAALALMFPVLLWPRTLEPTASARERLAHNLDRALVFIGIVVAIAGALFWFLCLQEAIRHVFPWPGQAVWYKLRPAQTDALDYYLVAMLCAGLKVGVT